MTRVLGLDVGGTHSRARLLHDDEVIGEASGPSASLAAAGRERAADAMASVLGQLSLQPGAGLDAVCIGTAGTSARESDAFFVDLLSPLTSTGRVVVVNDARLVLAAGGLTDGIACIAGTGSIAVGVVAGREQRAGGWGYLLGDEGSGYWVTRMALRELAERNDSHLALGALGDAVLGATGCPDFTSLFQRWYDRPSPDAWAALAPLVLDCGDPFTGEVTTAAASALAAIVSSVHRRLGSPPDLSVLLAGGLLTNHEGLAASTLLAIESSVPAVRPRVATEPPVAGAVQLALQAATGGRKAPHPKAGLPSAITKGPPASSSPGGMSGSAGTSGSPAPVGNAPVADRREGP
jgi:glucosamine kinase